MVLEPVPWSSLFRSPILGIAMGWGCREIVRSEWLQELAFPGRGPSWLLLPEVGVSFMVLPLLVWLLVRWTVLAWCALASRRWLRGVVVVGLLVQGALLTPVLSLMTRVPLSDDYPWILGTGVGLAFIHAILRPRRRWPWAIASLVLLVALAWVILPRAHGFAIVVEKHRRPPDPHWRHEDTEQLSELIIQSDDWSPWQLEDVLAGEALPERILCGAERQLVYLWLRQEGAYDGAVAWFEERIDTDPWRCEIPRRLILANMVVDERPEEAIALVEEAVQLWESGRQWEAVRVPDHCGLGDDLLGLGRPDLAFRIWAPANPMVVWGYCRDRTGAFITERHLRVAWWRSVCRGRMP